jgi:hypothetical protein
MLWVHTFCCKLVWLLELLLGGLFAIWISWQHSLFEEAWVLSAVICLCILYYATVYFCVTYDSHLVDWFVKKLSQCKWLLNMLRVYTRFCENCQNQYYDDTRQSENHQNCIMMIPVTMAILELYWWQHSMYCQYQGLPTKSSGLYYKHLRS